MIQVPIDHSFDRFQSRIIGLPEVMGTTDLVPLEEQPSATSEGFDDMTIQYATKRTSLTVEELSALFPLGTQLGTRKWWVVGSKPTCVAPGFWRADVRFKGWAQNKPVKISTAAAAEDQSAENIVTPDGTFARVAVTENTPTMRVSYLLEDYTNAPTDEVGRAKVPPSAVSVPPSIWDYLTQFVYHYPNGWVLMSSEIDQLPGCTAAAVIDSYKFIREITP